MNLFAKINTNLHQHTDRKDIYLTLMKVPMMKGEQE
jgi:hypothetical protein